MKYISVVIGRDPVTGQLTIDKAATRERVAEVRRAASTRASVGLRGVKKVAAKKTAKKAAKKR